MHGMNLDLDQITAREKEIVRLIDALQKEANDLAVARRVFERFSGKSQDKEDALAAGLPRPKGAPTTFEMVDFSLANAEKEGIDGLSSKELVSAIGAKYWPGVVPHQIMPTVYGFVKDNRLRKTPGGKFKRLKKAEE